MSLSISNSRRYFLVVALVYFVSLVVFVATSEFMVRRWVIPRSGFEQLRTSLHTQTAQRVAFGDSRAANGIIGAADFANLAYAGTNLETVLDAINFYQARQPISQLVLQAAPHQFAPYRLNRDQSAWRDDLLKKNSPWLAMLRAPYRQYLFQYWKSLPQFLIRANKPKVAENQSIPRFSDQSASAQKRDAQIRVNEQTPVAGFRQTRPARRLGEVLRRLQGTGTKICLVGFPVSRAYREAADQDPLFTDVRQFYREVALSTGSVSLDFWDAYDDRLFANADHLNAEGAHRLTADIKQLCWAENQ